MVVRLFLPFLCWILMWTYLLARTTARLRHPELASRQSRFEQHTEGAAHAPALPADVSFSSAAASAKASARIPPAVSIAARVFTNKAAHPE